jgi:NADH dehydrogenase [ubiquinone] 1 alpha subcomplex assembly factor 7
MNTKLHYSEMSTPDRATVASGTRKEFMTPLCEDFIHRINVEGNITLGTFMKDCLMHPSHGYYSTKKNVIQGGSQAGEAQTKKGGAGTADFITAAELPYFGDILAAWVVDCWQKMGTPRGIHLIELGPGRGTLMKTILTQIQAAAPQLFAFLNIHLVEGGAARAEEQRKTLATFQTAHGKIKWHMSLDSMPHQLEPIIVIANEFFDALPVTHFHYTERGWVETMLRVNTDPGTERHFDYVHAPLGTMTAHLIPEEVRKNGKLGQMIELNLSGVGVAEKLAQRVCDATRGAACLIDYGKDEHMGSTLRGIRGHKFVDPLLSPGDVDLSAWVSFRQLRWAIERMEQSRRYIKVHPLLTQRDFLEQNGIDVRLAQMIKDQETKAALKMLQMYKRLMDPGEMGESYKVMCFQTKNFPTVAPFL